ncbi:SNPC4 protein, partial [Geococcyx californianus]|nr:SNPC4 protein [Geococcyx californianus]
MSRRSGPTGAPCSPGAFDLDAERERIRREIEELERSLGAGGAVSDCSLSSGSGARPPFPRINAKAHQPLPGEVEREDDSSDNDVESSLPQDPETCLQMNHVYQEIIQEKLEEVELLIAQNKEEQKEIMCELGGPKIAKAGDGRNLPANIFLGHFMKPYFKDKTTGIGPPPNEEAKEKAAQGIKSFEQLLSTKWKSREKTLLQKSIVSDRLQRLLQPKLLKMSYWNQKLEKVKTETEKQILEKRIKELEQEIEEINQLPESVLIGNRFDEHDWEKISNIHFDGQRNSEELRKFWQNWEHPSINKKEWTDEEIQRLKKIAAEHNYLDWQMIAQELGTNRTPFQCLQKYQIYLNKDLKRKEWTKDEDQMLLELVQEMRVGGHIPYKKIAYYMEGRDSAQLIYRWTKRVDPSLKKGPWKPEEDAMLLAAVKKYGARDWYKIRTEVPGRSDAQCRDRYLKALHCDVKKGKWSLEEEEQLIELVQKHGLGHWSKVASELPHRTGSQCLSKWKLMIGSKKKRSRSTKHQDIEESSSESSSEDVELDLSDSSEEETTSKEECAFPSIDLWIPTQTNTQESKKGWYQTPSLFFPGSTDVKTSSSEFPSATCDGDKDKSSELYTDELIVCEMLFLLYVLLCFCFQASRCGKKVLWVSLEDVRKILRHNTCLQRKLVSASFCLMLQSSAAVLRKASGASTSCGQKLPEQQNNKEKTYRQERERLRRMSLDRKLLMAVTPWVGNVLLPCTLQTGKMAFYHTKAHCIQEKMKSINITSTPLFTLFIQLFQIDTNGCMKIIRDRRLQQLDLLRSNSGRPQQEWLLKILFNLFNLFLFHFPSSVGNSPQSSAQRNSRRGVPRNAVGTPVASKARESSAAGSESCTPAMQGALPAQGQRQKPKTVSELLREKRLRESQAKKAVQGTVFVAPQMLVSAPLIVQHPPQQILPSAKAGSKPAAAAAGCANSQVQCKPAPLPALSSVADSTTIVLQNRSSSVSETGECPGSSEGMELQSNKKLIEQALRNSPDGGISPGMNPAATEKAPNLEGPVNLLPALVTPQTGSPLIANSILPFTWVVTPQALLPTAVQTVVGVPQGLPAAAVGSQCQMTVTSSGNLSDLAVPPVPAAANTPHPSSAETKSSSTQEAEGISLGKTGNYSTVPLPVTSASPGCTTSSASSAVPACPDGFSKASDSSAAQTTLPADAATLRAELQPQTQQPTSTQGSVPYNSVPRNTGCFAAQALKNRPIASKPPTAQPADSPPQPTTSSTEKNPLDFSLISLEDEELVKEWLSGKHGVQVPSLQTRLPYLPPFLCNLKTLSKLLLQKAALEEQAARLLPLDAGRDEGTGVDLNAIRELVEQKLGNNPAYLLLKARFLAAFTLPAVLATLPPPKVVTTLSGSRKQFEESDEEEWQSEKEVSE